MSFRSDVVTSEPEPGFLQSAVKQARLALVEVTGPLGEVKDQAKHIYETGVAHSKGEI